MNKLMFSWQLCALVGLGALIFEHEAAAKACDNKAFENFYSAVKLNAGNPNYTRLDKTPDNYNGFKEDCYHNTTNGTCLKYFGKRYKLVATSAPTRRWSAAICGRVNQGDHQYNREHRIFLEGRQPFYAGPRVSFQYQKKDGRWAIIKGTNPGNGLLWHFGATGTPHYRWKSISHKPRRFRIVVDHAMKYDEFDLKMGW